MKKWYKIVDLIDGQIKTLFHGNDGSRILRMDDWLQADMKPVKDGTSKTTYTSGWHIAPTLEECIEYLDKFQNVEPKAIVLCRAINVWPKTHSPSNIYLSQYIFIEKVVWTYADTK